MGRTYSITEHGSFITGKKAEGFVALPGHTFAQLENFILSNKGSGGEAIELMGISLRRGIGKIITARNFVGIITMKDGTNIEILPKISDTEGGETDPRVKKLLIDMLKTLRDFPCRSIQTTNVDTARMSIFEIFIRMFIDEVIYIAKRGLKHDYEPVRNNSSVFRGKLIVTGQIKHNYAHMERSYVQYDEFDLNCPENRLIKAALLFLYGQTSSNRNKSDIRILLNVFDEAEASTDYEGDFGRIVPDRKMADYDNALRWARVFLTGKSFSSFTGSEVAYALLFPMETLFESYTAALMRRSLNPNVYKISVQDSGYHLFDYPSKRFLMKPDIVVIRLPDKETFIFDTKWKLLSAEKFNYGISQADMYQMYAYQKKYGAKHVTLLYPESGDMPEKNIEFVSGDGAEVRIRFIDMFDAGNSVRKIAESI